MTRIYVRCFPELAFVPSGDIIDAFDILSETKPDGLQEETIDQLNLFIDFFEHTYVRGRRLRGRGENYGQPVFSIDLWNKHASSLDGIARSTNAVEGWHHGLQSLYQCHHPTLWTFMTGIVADIHKQKALLLQAASGQVHIVNRKYRNLDQRVQQAVSAYGQTEVLLYLRAIAHLSHS